MSITIDCHMCKEHVNIEDIHEGNYCKACYNIETSMFYAGIGARNTPDPILTIMTESAVYLASLGYTLRSGGADGADTAFEVGAINKEIYLPWKGFNGNPSEMYQVSTKAYVLASQHHPAWNKCSSAARAFHARNCHQVLGYDLVTPSTFILCWTPNGLAEGGTGQAIRIARAYKIPVINMQHDDWKPQIRELLGE